MFETPVVKLFLARRKSVSEKKPLFFPKGKYRLVTLVIPRVGYTENTLGVVPQRAEALSEGNFLLEYSAWKIWSH